MVQTLWTKQNVESGAGFSQANHKANDCLYGKWRLEAVVFLWNTFCEILYEASKEYYTEF